MDFPDVNTDDRLLWPNGALEGVDPAEFTVKVGSLRGNRLISIVDPANGNAHVSINLDGEGFRKEFMPQAVDQALSQLRAARASVKANTPE